MCFSCNCSQNGSYISLYKLILKANLFLGIVGTRRVQNRLRRGTRRVWANCGIKNPENAGIGDILIISLFYILLYVPSLKEAILTGSVNGYPQCIVYKILRFYINIKFALRKCLDHLCYTCKLMDIKRQLHAASVCLIVA